jgi:hypothetical protein
VRYPRQAHGSAANADRDNAAADANASDRLHSERHPRHLLPHRHADADSMTHGAKKLSGQRSIMTLKENTDG